MIVLESLSKNEILDGVKCKYFYRLVKTEISAKLQCDTVKIECFGIEVERQDIVDNCVVKFEREIIEKISTYRHKVHNLLKLVFENTVSPIHLVDILGEYVDDYAFDFDEIETSSYAMNK